MLSNKDVISWYRSSEQNDVKWPIWILPRKIASIVPVDGHSAFYPKGVQSILWDLSKSHQWHIREWQPTKQHPVYKKAYWATPEQTCAAAGCIGGIGPVSCRRMCRTCSASCVLDLPQLLPLQSWHASILPTSHPASHWSSDPLPCGLCAGCRCQGPNTSYAMVLLVNILCGKSFSVGTVYIVNKVD